MSNASDFHEGRYDRTIQFVRAGLQPPARVLDLGTANALGQRMQASGLEVQNTSGDLDLDFDHLAAASETMDAVTAFEILEHLVAPFNALRALQAPRLFATVPLRLWFAPAYRSPSDPWDRHFHEFEDWQFDWLLEKAGWQIVRREKWPSPVHAIGFRPLIRRFVPRHYAVEAVRSPGA